MIKISFLIILFLLCFSSASAKEESLHQKVFGINENITSTKLPLMFQGKELNQIRIKANNEEVIEFSKEDILVGLSKVLLENKLKKIRNTFKDFIKPSDFLYSIKYKINELKLEIELPLEDLKAESTFKNENSKDEYSKMALQEANISGAINLRAESSFSGSKFDNNYQSLNFNSFINWNNFILENHSLYSNKENRKWARGETVIVKDDEENLVRYHLGDFYNKTVGYMPNFGLLGFRLTRENSIDPYLPTNSNTRNEFVIENKSFVRYYVNNNLIRSEFLDTGKYSIKNIPLNNGINNVLVEIESEGGEKKSYFFKEAFSNDLLKKGENEFDFSIGLLSKENEFQKKYDSKNGGNISTFLKRGIDEKNTIAVYSQYNKFYFLAGFEHVYSTVFGSFTLSAAKSENANHYGDVIGVGYNISAFNKIINDSIVFNLKIEQKSKQFSDSLSFVENRFKNTMLSNIVLPINEIFNLGFGTQYLKANDQNYADRYGGDLSFNTSFLKNINLTVYGSRIRDEYKKWQNLVYFFLNISLIEESSTLSSYFENQSQTKRLSYLYNSNENKIEKHKVMVDLEDGKYNREFDLDLQYTNQYTDLGLRQVGRNQNNITSTGRTYLRGATALLFAKNDEKFQWTISKPTSNSFIIMYSDDKLERQKIGVGNNKDFLEAETNSRGVLSVTDLPLYFYKFLQIDTSNLKLGQTIKRESFVIKPRYKSGHLIKIETNGLIAVKGRFLNHEMKPISLQLAKLINNGNEYPLFTNNSGKFFLESAMPGKNIIKFNDSNYKDFEFFIDDNNKSLIIDLKDVVIEKK